jgi:hypothetical protein
MVAAGSAAGDVVVVGDGGNNGAGSGVGRPGVGCSERPEAGSPRAVPGADAGGGMSGTLGSTSKVESAWVDIAQNRQRRAKLIAPMDLSAAARVVCH